MHAVSRLIGGRYRLQHRLGEGGMANVYLAIDEKLSRRVAIKVLHPHMARNEEIRARFRLEAQAVSSLDHPNIVKIYDYSGSKFKDLWLVTELIEGSNLAELMRSGLRQPFHPIVALCIGKEVCKALEEAHGKGLVHRDIKPENIMITSQGRLKLMDFGIAKDLRQHSVTQTGAFMGSPSYMSPEQIKGKDIDHRTDLYSLGVVLYELITGTPPFVGRTTHDVVLKIVEGKYIPARELVPQLLPAVDRLISKSLQRSPSGRFRGAGELGKEIDHLLAGLGFVESHVELERYFKDRGAFEARLLQVNLMTSRQAPRRNPVETRAATVRQGQPAAQSLRQKRLRTTRMTGQATQAKTLRTPSQRQRIAPPFRVRIQQTARLARWAGQNRTASDHSTFVIPNALNRFFGVAIVALAFGISIWGFLAIQPRMRPPKEAATKSPASASQRQTLEPSRRQERSADERNDRQEPPTTPSSRSPFSDRRATRTAIVRRHQSAPGPAAHAPDTPTLPQARREAPKDTNSISGPSMIQVSSSPAAEIFIDGNRMGTTVDATTSSGWIEVSPGRHRLELRRPGYENYLTYIALAHGDRLRTPSIELTRARSDRNQTADSSRLFPLTLEISSLPANLYIINQQTGDSRSFALRSTKKSLDLPAGTYTVRVLYKGKSKQRVISLPTDDGGLTFYANFADDE